MFDYLPLDGCDGSGDESALDADMLVDNEYEHNLLY